MPGFPDSPRRLLVRSTNWIGDAIMTTPAIRALRAAFPGSEITLLALPWVADVFTASPRLDRILLYEKNGRHRGVQGRIRLIRELKKERFDAAILLQNAFEAALITTLAAIPVRGGYATDGRRLLLSHPVSRKVLPGKQHEVYYYLGILEGLGLSVAGEPALELFLEETARQEAASLLAERNMGRDRILIGLNPGAAYGPAKRWPAEKYGSLARRLIRELEADLVVFGTEADREAAQCIGELSGCCARVLDLTGRTRLATAMACIATCRAFVSNDSGLMHVAAALGVPLVAIFGSTNDRATGPFAQKVRVVRKGLDCSPCKKTHCPRGHLACMEDIGVSDVFSALKDLLEAR